MTAAALTIDIPGPSPTVAVCAGRMLALAGLVFGAANLAQWAILSGALDLHPAWLALNWAIAVGVFVTGSLRLRRAGGEAGYRVGGWSRGYILLLIGVAVALAAVSASAGDWSLMRWSGAAGLTLYAAGWGVAAVRCAVPNMGVLFLVSLAGAAAAAMLFGTPDQYLIQACTLALAAFLPGLWLALGRRL